MKIFVAKFREIERWDVKFLSQVDWAWGSNAVVPFGDVAERRVEPVDISAVAPEDLRLGSIHFDGSMTVRENSGILPKGKLFAAHPGDLVFSKIDARNGAFGVVPEELGILLFSTEYPIYDFVNRGRLRAPIMKLLCRSETFRSKVNALVVGHSGRKRVSPEQMEELALPVPDPDVQDLILKHYRGNIEEANRAEKQARKLQASIAKAVLEHLGIEQQEFRRLKRPFVMRYREVDRWSVTRAMFAAQGITEEPVGKYPLRRLGESDLADVSYGIPVNPDNRPGENARPYLRVANVQEARLDLREIKKIDVPDSMMDSFRLLDGDLLLCEGNSEELVGRPAIWRNEIADCVHQNHILRVRLNQDVVVPEYVLAYMNTPPARLYFTGRAKRTTNLASINSTDVREMPIPIPPKPIQKTIVRQVAKLRLKVLEQQKQVFELRRKAQDEAEMMIMGTMPV